MSTNEPTSAAYQFGNSRKIKKVKVPWTSNSGGVANVTTTHAISGFLAGVEFVPGEGGSQPSANYDVVVNTEDGTDLLSGKGANRSNANPEYIAPGIPISDGTTDAVAPPAYDGKLTVGVTNAGDTKTGTVNIFIY